MHRSVAFAASLTLFTASLAAQTEPRKFGLGMAITGTSGGILIPLALSPRQRLEPEVLFFTSSSTTNVGSGQQQETKSTNIQLGVGLLVLTDAGTDTKVYLGPRVGIVWTRFASDDPFSGQNDAEHTDWFLSVAAGGEHFLAERFSLGGEARLSYYHAGEIKGSGFAIAGTRLSTGGAAFLRWYP